MTSMGNRRKIRALKSNKKNKNNHFSTVSNIQVIDESVITMKPSKKSDSELENKTRSKDIIIEQSNKVERSKISEELPNKLRKRKLPNTVESPEKKQARNKSVTQTITKPDTKAENTTEADFDEDEANIKDEDIDKFCDEIDDDDNAQYELWVKLVEEKLRGNK